MRSAHPQPRSKPDLVPEGVTDKDFYEIGLTPVEYERLMQSMREVTVCASKAAFEMRHVRKKAESCQEDTRSLRRLDAAGEAAGGGES